MLLAASAGIRVQLDNAKKPFEWLQLFLILQTSENVNKFDTAQFIVAPLSVFQEQSSSGTSRCAKMLTARYCHNRDFTTCNHPSQMEKEEILNMLLSSFSKCSK